MVTHDQQEALSFADRVAVMRDGRLEQVGDPVEVYRSPVSAFVAGFLGRTNLLRGTATGMSATTALGEVPLDRSATGRVVLALRPEHLSFAPSTQAPDPDGSPVRQPGTGARVKIVRREFRGHDVTFECLLLADGGSTDLAQAGEVRLSVIASPDLETTVGDVLSVVVTGAAVVLGQGATGSQRTEAATTRHVG